MWVMWGGGRSIVANSPAPWLPLVFVTAMFAGYLLGRVRPWKRAQDWAAWQVIVGDVQTRRKALLLLAPTPRGTIRALWKMACGVPPKPTRPTASEPIRVVGHDGSVDRG